MAYPTISSAIPQRRYQFGDFTLVVLSDIESTDSAHYHYLMGIIAQGKQQPELFISLENQPNSAPQIQLRAEHNSQCLPGGGPWKNLDSFIEDALRIAAKLLNLDMQAYEPYRLQ